MVLERDDLDGPAAVTKRVYAVDLGSTNGSYVNGQRVVGQAELTDGSTITMGRSRMTFRLLATQDGTGHR